MTVAQTLSGPQWLAPVQGLGKQIMDILLHVGAHRTGTTSFQRYLADHADPIAAQGTCVWGPRQTRGGLFAGLFPASGMLASGPNLVNGRVSLLIGVGAAVVSVAVGLLIGLVAGYFRLADSIIMRIMDSLMAIPAILLAIALVALNGPSVTSVIIAITVPEVPRVVRLVRSVVLTAREEPYVEAAIALGSSMPKVLLQHLMPNTFAPLIVQGTYICASAILIEAILSFLGAGVSTEIPTWGNIMAEGRSYFQIKPGLIFWPGLMLSLCILAINLLGDTARDILDPRMKKREV